jgi:hypothetical protein
MIHKKTPAEIQAITASLMRRSEAERMEEIVRLGAEWASVLPEEVWK